MEPGRRPTVEFPTQTVNRLSMSIEEIRAEVSHIHDDIHMLIERFAPTSPCAFCPLDENMDRHQSADYYNYPEPFLRNVRAVDLHLCGRCLRPVHGGSCHVKYASYRGEHKVLLCGQSEQ
ncbi:unnamed protein product [Haemonchus placei]|uniref:Movement protein n=1 Tax=Haemonchus placei TaxID=6290 RepID=A0A0N4VTR1_HAEPC|nr:unnamed protein product [Haemonchus placei]